MKPSAMGTLLFQCPGCEQPIQSPSFSLGVKGCCPYCGREVVAADQAGEMDVMFVDPAALVDRRIEPSDFNLLLELMASGWDGARVAVDAQFIGEMLEMHPKWTARRIKKGVRRLERAGYICTERDPDNRASSVHVQVSRPVKRMIVSDDSLMT